MASTTYYWDEVDDNVCCEEDENGEITASYTHEPGLYGEVIAQKRGDDVRYFNFDGEGNTCELTDEDENVTDTYEYSAFGEEVARTGTTENPFGYKGALGYYANSETNEIYVRARTYEPKIGRWLSKDPIYPNGSEINIYLHARNSPLEYADPSGLDFIALADRQVDILPFGLGTLQIAWHYSLQYWYCPCNKPDICDIYTESRLEELCYGPANRVGPERFHSGHKIAGLELLAHDMRAWSVVPDSYRPKRTYKWKAQNIKVAVIHHSDSGVRISPIYIDTDQAVKTKWDNIVAIADSYAWAEHGSPPPFTNWVRSLYLWHATNSNTFVRYVTGQAGVRMCELPALHPGDMSPKQNRWPNVHFFTSEPPWQGAPDPPKPSRPPSPQGSY